MGYTHTHNNHKAQTQTQAHTHTHTHTDTQTQTDTDRHTHSTTTARSSSRDERDSRVVELRVNALVINDVLESKVHETALARVVTLGHRAVHQLLLRQGGEATASNLNATLGRARGRECLNCTMAQRRKR
jgi:hypothetical protein